MGSPLSPIIADLVLQDLETSIIDTSNWKLTFYYRYVDDILLATNAENIPHIIDKFNEYHERLKFTVESEEDRSISFLDISINVIEDAIYVDWFHKKTFSGRFLSFYSNHPTCHKLGTIYNLVDRALLLSHPRFHVKNLQIVINILLSNGYPLALIFNEINRRIKILICGKLNITDKENNKGPHDNMDKNNKFVAIPYVESISEKISANIKKSDVNVGYRVLKNLNTWIKTHKDKNEDASNSNVVYKINCRDCDATYIGQTKRQLRTRLNEHKNNFKLDSARHSVISEHILNNKHTFDWEGTEILDHEINYNKRLISEMLYIKEHKNSINLKKDIESLESCYFDILEELSDTLF